MASRLQPIIQIGSALLVRTVDPKPMHGTILFGDWLPTGDGYYYIDLVHNFNELLMPQVQFMDSDGFTFVENVFIQDKDTLRVRIPGTPDCRFSGSVRLSRV